MLFRYEKGTGGAAVEDKPHSPAVTAGLEDTDVLQSHVHQLVTVQLEVDNILSEWLGNCE